MGNIYAEILERAREKEATHHQRRGMKLRQWFKDHPECYHPTLPPFEDGSVLRDRYGRILRNESERITLDFRMGPGWFDRVTDDHWVGLPQERCNRSESKWRGLASEETISEMEYSARQVQADLEWWTV